MTASCCQTTETLGESIAAALREKKPVMLASLAERFGVSELEVARALPDEARAFAGKDAFDTVWQALASWENATFIMAHLGSVIEIKGKIPEGRHGHGYFNLSGGSGLGGHLKIDDLGHICFLSLPFMGLESHSVQFFNAAWSCSPCTWAAKTVNSSRQRASRSSRCARPWAQRTRHESSCRLFVPDREYPENRRSHRRRSSRL